MTDKKNAGDAIAEHIAGLERQVTTLTITNSGLRDEMNARAVEAATATADLRVQRQITSGLQDALRESQTEREGMRKTFMETGLLIQDQLNNTRTELEASHSELRAERNRPRGSTEFILNLIMQHAAQSIRDYFNRRVMHSAFNRKDTTTLQSDFLSNNPVFVDGDELPVPAMLQEIVKLYCATSNTAFDTEALLSDVSNYIDENAEEILKLEPVVDFRTLRGSIAKNTAAERTVLRSVENLSCPELISDLFKMTTGEYYIGQAQHNQAILDAIKHNAASFIEEISFEIPVTIE